MKKYDIFLFFNELDMLDLRLEMYNDYVDYFVIVESTVTFSGLKKELFYENNKDRYKKYEEKIIHYIVDDTPESYQKAILLSESNEISESKKIALKNALNSGFVPEGASHWLRNFYQMEMMKEPIKGLDDNDFCFISDLDEFWNPLVSIDFNSDNIYKMHQLMYSYYLNNRSSEQWAGTYCTKYKNIKNASLNNLDSPQRTSYIYLDNGGWHFTNIGDVNRVISKIEASGHIEYNREDIKSQLAERMVNNKDFVGREFNFWVDSSKLPPLIINKYQHMMKK